MKPIPISLQLYTLREEAKKDLPAVLKKTADIGYAGVEFAGLHGMKPAELRRILDDLGLAASSAHGPLPTEENVREVIDTAKALGHNRHISGFGPDHFATKEKVIEAAAMAQNAADLLEGSGITYGLHNHWWEFEKRFDGKAAHDILMEAAPGAFAQIDTYWVQTGGGDVPQVLRKLGSRAPLPHIKDGPADSPEADMTAIGGGVMDWPAIMEAMSPATEWLVVELDRCATDMTEAAAASCRYLTGQGFAKGNT